LGDDAVVEGDDAGDESGFRGCRLRTAGTGRRTCDVSGHLLRFLVHLVLVATRAVLLPLDALGVQALVLGGEVVAILALAAGEDDFFSGHANWLVAMSGGLWAYFSRRSTSCSRPKPKAHSPPT